MSKFKEAVKAVKVQTMVTAIVFIVIGILFIAFPESSLRVLCYIAGGIMIFLGACRLVFYIVEMVNAGRSNSLVGGIMLLVLGIVFLVYPDVITGLFTIIFGVVMILDGITTLQEAVNGALAKSRGWWIDLIIACVVLALGIIVLVCRASSWIMVFTGIAMIVEGVIDFAGAVYFSSKARVKVEPAGSGPEVIDV